MPKLFLLLAIVNGPYGLLTINRIDTFNSFSACKAEKEALLTVLKTKARGAQLPDLNCYERTAEQDQ